MNAFSKFCQSELMRGKLKWVVGGELLLIAGIVVGVTFQVRTIKSKIGDMADLKDPSPFTNVLNTFAGKTSGSVFSYLQTHDWNALQTVADSSRGFDEALFDFQKINPKMLPETARVQIAQTYKPFSEAGQDLVRVSDAQHDRWETLRSNDDRILFLFENRLRPLIRSNQARSLARLDVLTYLQSHVREIPRNVTYFLFNHSGELEREWEKRDQKFEKLLQLYDQFAQSASEHRNLNEVHSLWTVNRKAAQEILALERNKTDSVKAFTTAQQTIQSTLNKVLPPVRPEEIIRQKDAILHAVTHMIMFVGLLTIIGIVSIVASGIWMYRQVREYVQEITRVTNAAITGDLSRQVDVQDSAMGGVASSVNRLIGVLRRSEQLNYQLGTIVESTGDGAIGMNLQGDILSWNQGAQRMYGYTMEDINGKHAGLLFHPAHMEDFQTIFSLLQTDKRGASVETVHLRKSGVSIRVRLAVSRILDANGGTIGLSLLSRELEVISAPAPKPGRRAA